MSCRFLILWLGIVLYSSIGYAYLNIEQYCKSFDENFQPIICILKSNKNGTNYVVDNRPVHRPRPRPPRPTGPPVMPVYPILYPVDNGPPPYDYYDNQDHDTSTNDCSCDLTCYPVIANQNTTGVIYRCRSCGSACTIKNSAKVRCSCAVPSGNASCTCSASCASFRMGNYNSYDDDSEESSEDSNCIFTISSLVDRRIGEEQRPYNCECCKSTEAENTSQPDFVCICQMVSATGASERKQIILVKKRNRIGISDTGEVGEGEGRLHDQEQDSDSDERQR